jgi:V8-like Glu-specific endopeptidase
MKNISFAAFLLSLFLSLSSNAEEKMGIIGFDDRQGYWNIDFDEYPGKAIGQLRINKGNALGLCSGFMAAPNAVITAAHCLSQHGMSDPKPQDVEFWLRFNGTEQANDRKYKARAYYMRDEWRRTMNPQYDYAVILLEQRTMEDGATMGSFENASIIDKEGNGTTSVRIAGYPGSKGGRLYFDTSAEYGVDRERNLMLHKADIEKGQSGGPVIAGKQIIGVHSYMSEEGNVSVVFNNAILQELRGWMAR